MSVCLHVYLSTTCVQCLWRPEEGGRVSGPGITDGCEPPCDCWELNPSPLQKQPVFLATEPSLAASTFLSALAHGASFAFHCLFGTK